MSLPCGALVLSDIPAWVQFISILWVTLRAKNTGYSVHKYHMLSLAVSFPENLGIRNKSSPVAHCLLYLSVVILCICLTMVLLTSLCLQFSGVVGAAGGEIHKWALRKCPNTNWTICAEAPVSQTLLTLRIERWWASSLTWHTVEEVSVQYGWKPFYQRRGSKLLSKTFCLC